MPSVRWLFQTPINLTAFKLALLRVIRQSPILVLYWKKAKESAFRFSTNSQMSVTLKEWNIPLQNLQLGEMIGRGTIGTVYRGKWHGEVAVKRIDILDDNDDNGASFLRTFKREVATLPKLRHENLMLFMGASTKPPDLAIITQLSKVNEIRLVAVLTLPARYFV